MSATVGVVTEIEIASHGGDHAGDVDIHFTERDRRTLVMPAFSSGDGRLLARYAPEEAGAVTYRSASTHGSLDGITGAFRVDPYGGGDLLRRGRLRVSADGRTLEHLDGTRFLWIGDTWWMGLGSRLDWPDGFRTLLEDRVRKGFNVVQVVAGPLPDFAATDEGIWHPQQANEGGWPWDRGWARINPGYYEAADRKIAALVEAGIVPCIVGMWGFYGPVIGRDRAIAHWRHLVARYAAYPVVFCAAGEFDAASFDMGLAPSARAELAREQSAIWADVLAAIKRYDPYDNPVTVHRAYGSSRELVVEPGRVDIDMLQSSHWTYQQPPDGMRRDIETVLGLADTLEMGLPGALRMTRGAVEAEPPMPVINAEPAYEGILGGNWEDVQRFDAWTGLLMGLAGYTYGADGIWQMSSSSEGFANMVSRWGDTTWQRAMHYEGGRQVGLARVLLERFEWWRLRPVPAERAREAGRLEPFGAESDVVALYYLPSLLLEERFQGMRGLPLDIPGGASAMAGFFDPRTGRDHPIGAIAAGPDGRWSPPDTPTFGDWLLVIERT